ncbi:uncharacterized protein SAMN05421538_104233 [Paracoccus isoporae]|uniref:TPM domain-containing protein n=1 Tax=Paracoccus isoporae TaxID=591205 RepID=A0A1G7ARU8_9RHOB|nr:TPM domain-containing protein [Paracoccus isoporae]SDE17598.1 uncharacterized protein SAMN05421538_104233 [Paracoccus isoporae]
MIRAIVIWLLLALPCAAQNLPDWDVNSITDRAGILSGEDARIIDQALIALNEQTGVEGTVVTLTDRGRYGGTDGLEPFATRLFNDWGVGNAERNDGFMVLFLRDDREARIELGAGYPAGYDDTAQRIMDGTMLPAFRDGDYSAGLREGALAVIDQIARPHAQGTTPPRPRLNWFQRNTDKVVEGFLGLVGLLGAFFYGRSWWNVNRCPTCGARGIITEQSPLRVDLGDGSWKLERDRIEKNCPECGWSEITSEPRVQSVVIGSSGEILSRSRNRDHRSHPSRWSGGGGGGGRGGGFGGGSSSGGGASGRW